MKEVQSHFHAATSKPDGPAAPSILRTVLHINWPSIRSKMMGWGSVAGVFGFTIVSSLRGCFGGCFFRRMSRTLSEGMLGSIMLFRHNGWPVFSSAIGRSAALTLPSIMNFLTIAFP